MWTTIGVYRDIPEELRVLVEPIVGDAGLELMDATLARGGRPWLLRVTIDTPEGDGLVSVERCAKVSREIGTHLDATGLIEANYRLEVSSPGLDRMLAREKDFAAARGSEVRIETRRPIENRRRFAGLLRDFDEDIATVVVDGQAIEIPFAEIAKGNAVYKFSRADFAREVNSR